MRPNDLLKTFVGEMQRRYPSVIFRFEYDEEEGMHRIWHTYTDVYLDESFNSAIGELITSLFVPADFFNYYIELNVQYIEESKLIDQWVCPIVIKISTGLCESPNKGIGMGAIAKGEALPPDNWKATSKEREHKKSSQTLGMAA